MKLDLQDTAYLEDAKKLFLLYLENPLKMHFIKQQVKLFGFASGKDRQDIHDATWDRYITNVKHRTSMDQEKDRTLYKHYLELFYNNGSDFKEFKEHFDQKFLSEVFEEFQFLAGKELKKDLENIKKYELLAKKVMIQILDFNPEIYKKNDRVKLHLELKNVPTLYVKIFEFNSENYYRKNLAPFRTDVNLDGLISTDEKVYEFKEPPQKKF